MGAASAAARVRPGGLQPPSGPTSAPGCKAAIPLGPDSPEAQALYDEWQDLLAPFKAVATPAMMAGATKMYEKMGEWQSEPGAPSPGFDAETFGFIQAIGRGRKAQGAQPAPSETGR